MTDGTKGLEPVEMHIAYMWDCLECGSENFQRAVTQYLDPNREGDAEAIVGLYGELPDDKNCRYAASTYPNRVVCRHCKREFNPIAVSGPPTGDASDE